MTIVIMRGPVVAHFNCARGHLIEALHYSMPGIYPDVDACCARCHGPVAALVVIQADRPLQRFWKDPPLFPSWREWPGER